MSVSNLQQLKCHWTTHRLPCNLIPTEKQGSFLSWHTYSLSCGKFLYTRNIRKAAIVKTDTKIRRDVRADPPSAWAFPGIRDKVNSYYLNPVVTLWGSVKASTRPAAASKRADRMAEHEEAEPAAELAAAPGSELSAATRAPRGQADPPRPRCRTRRPASAPAFLLPGRQARTATPGRARLRARPRWPSRSRCCRALSAAAAAAARLCAIAPRSSHPADRARRRPRRQPGSGRKKAGPGRSSSPHRVALPPHRRKAHALPGKRGAAWRGVARFCAVWCGESVGGQSGKRRDAALRETRADTQRARLCCYNVQKTRV